MTDSCLFTTTDPGQTVNPAAVMRVIHYPPQTGEIDERVIGIGAHSEFVTFFNLMLRHSRYPRLRGIQNLELSVT